MTVPIANPVVSEAARDAVDDVLQSGMIADGETVRQFEREFAEFVGVEHAVATSSGTTALHAMLEAAGIGKGDTVLTSPFSFVSSANAIVHAGATPVFADVRESTGNLDPSVAREVLDGQDVDAIVPVHLYGLPADMEAFRELAAEYGCLLFEDAAQAHGATVGGEQVGSLGDAAAFSFYPTKNMTTGEGGMITTDDDDIAERARQVVDHGRTGTYEHAFVGYNYRLTNVAAAIGRHQLERLQEWNERRRETATYYSRAFDDLALETPEVPPERTHAFHQYTVRTDRRNRLKDTLDAHDVGYAVYYPRAIPDQPAYSDYECEIPTARRLSERVLSLPVHPQVDDADRERVVTAVRDGLEGDG